MYEFISTVVLFLLAAAWRTDDATNLTIKFILFSVVLWGIVETMISFGYQVN